PRIATQFAEPVQGGLGLFNGDVVAQGAPPALRRGVVGLLHHALAVPAPRWTDRDLDAVVLGHCGERRRHATGLGVTDRGHPIETPLAGQPVQLPAGLVESVDELGLILHWREVAAPAP